MLPLGPAASGQLPRASCLGQAASGKLPRASCLGQAATGQLPRPAARGKGVNANMRCSLTPLTPLPHPRLSHPRLPPSPPSSLTVKAARFHVQAGRSWACGSLQQQLAGGRGPWQRHLAGGAWTALGGAMLQRCWPHTSRVCGCSRIVPAHTQGLGLGYCFVDLGGLALVLLCDLRQLEGNGRGRTGRGAGQERLGGRTDCEGGRGGSVVIRPVHPHRGLPWPKAD
jgi:hypothetical protein